MGIIRGAGRVAAFALVAAGMLAAPGPVAGGTPEGSASQSPIDIRHEDVTFVDELPKIRFLYPNAKVEVINTGSPDPESTIRAVVNTPASVRVSGKRYRLSQFHFHTPSEHLLNGEAFPMELHLVHQANDGTLLVLGASIEPGDRHGELNRILRHLPVNSSETRKIGRFDLDEIIPGESETYRYGGSLTTPPFTEGVRWIVFDQPLDLSERRIAAFQELFPDGNAREPQPLNDRTIMSDLDLPG